MKTYIYPTYTPSRDKSGNLYIKNFHEAFKHNASYKVINRLWQLGITSLLFNFDAELFIIQWVDLIPKKKFGKIQFLIYLFSIFFVRLTRKKIVWVLHNKYAHNGKSKLVDFGMKCMSNCASIVITHAREGVSFFDNKFPKNKGKCFFVPHPVYSQELVQSDKILYDYVIWGSVNNRKNIVPFLKFCTQNDWMKQRKILICGRCGNVQYEKQIKELLSPNISFLNKFFSDEELKDVIKMGKVILFTYDTGSMLSSGALIYSLNFCKPIIGPNAGNFADLNGVVTCYNNFDEIPKLSIHFDEKCISEYLSSNSWDSLPPKITKLLK